MVSDPADDCFCSCLEIGKRNEGLRCYTTVAIGYRVAVRIMRWVTEVSVQPGYELFRLDMLQLLGDLMHLIPGKAELIYQKHLPKL